MSAQVVTEWLREKKPGTVVHYHGPDQDGIYWWRVDVHEGDDEGPPFRLGIPQEVLDNAGMLAERLADLENGGFLDPAGEEPWVVYLLPLEVAREPGAWE
jgi:hypothetical protein